jgi:dCMP deaminase
MTTNAVRHLCTLEEWDYKYFTLAHHIKTWSKDPKKKVGAVLVGGEDKRQVSLGVNGLPPGFDDRAWMGREDKNKFILHAERNVLDNAHFPTVGSTLYSTRFLCPSCAGSALSMGVIRVVVPPIEGDSSWAGEQEAALELLNGAADLVFVRDGLLDS